MLKITLTSHMSHTSVSTARRSTHGLIQWLTTVFFIALVLFAPAFAQTVNLPPILVTPLGNGSDGEIIAFNPNDGMIYHLSGTGTVFFEKINPLTNAVTTIVTFANPREFFGLVWYPPLNVFIATDRASNVFQVTPTGIFTNVGNNGVKMRGFALVGTRVFAVGNDNSNANDGKLFEINPANGAILSTTPVTLNGVPVTKALGLTTDPVTGQVYVLVTPPGGANTARALGLLNVNTGAATKLVDLPDAFSSITFVNFGNSDLYGVTGDGATVPETLYRFTISNRANPIEVSDQKPGSLLVFPFYKHDAQNKVDTRLTITNLGKLPINVHFLFMDGATCSEFDQFVCFTPNASIEWKASQFDPQNKGYVIAYTTDNMGRPIAYNGLIGNGFVNDGEYVGNYGAESFNSPLPVGAPLGAVATPGQSWTIPFDGIALDMVPTTFAVDIQSPVDTVNQKLVLAGLTGDAYAGKLSGVTQVGTGLAYNGHEALRSFSPFISGQCFVEKIVDSTTPKVTGQLSNLIPKGEVGTLRFSVTAAVGLLMTSNKNAFNGIRTLHKVQVAKSSIIIPLVMPDCQYWVNQQ